jgi:hypothetical protein
MTRYLLGLGVLWPLLFGCSGENIVAGKEKTQAEQLTADLPAWCPRVCARLRACPAAKGCECSPDSDVCDCIGIDDGCEEQCPAFFARYTGSEACAAIGQRIKNCLDRMTCDQLGGPDPCPATAAELDSCPEPNDGNSSDIPSGSSAGPSNGPTVGTPVTCAGSSGAGGGMPENGGPQVTCEEERDACSDGHAYSWICSQDSQGQRACACLVDADATASFVPASADCPALSQVNAGCGWALTQ